jgi:hypothetical protein
MATKITTALVAALVVGALMTPNHEALARGGGGFGGGGHGGGFGGGGFTVVASTVVDSGSTGDSDAATDSHAASDMDAASDFMVAIPTSMADMCMAAVRITTAPTNAIKQHGALLLWRAVAAAPIRTEPNAVVSSLQPDRPKHPPEYTKEY